MIKNIRYRMAQKNIPYCHAEDEVKNMFDFTQWVSDNGYRGIIIKGQDHLCYSPRLVMEYLTGVKGFQCVEIAESLGEVVDAEIIRQARGLSKLEIMD